MFRRKAKAVLLAAASAAGLAAESRPVPHPGFNLFSKQQDVQLGQQAEQQVLHQYEVVRNPVLEEFMNRVGQRLAATPEARRSGFEFRYYMLNSTEVNAFALPGGPVNVLTGLIKETDNEAQFAGVLAHEMSHVILRHGTSQASKANLLQLPAALAGAALSNSTLGGLAQAGLGLGLNGLFLKYSRGAESQADALGARLMSEAGYNPIEMARFFEKLESEGGRGVPQFLSDHPSPGNRVKAVEAEIRTFPQQQYGFSTGEFEQAKAQVQQLAPPPRSPRQQSMVNTDNSGDSGGYRRLQTQHYAFEYPSDWQPFGDQGSSSMTIAPRQGLVQGSNGDNALGYGVIASYFFPETSGQDLQQATSDLIHHLHAGNPGLQETSSRRQVRAGNASGLATQLTGESPFGGAETDLLVTVARPEGIFYMICVCPQRNWGQLEPVFSRMIQSVRFF